MSHIHSHNHDFEEYVMVHIYLDGIVLFESQEERYCTIRLSLNEVEGWREEKCEILRHTIEDRFKVSLAERLRSKIQNVVETSRKYDLPVKRIIQTYFINQRYDHMKIEWSPSAKKEFQYVPMKHYLENRQDSLILKVQSVSFVG